MYLGIDVGGTHTDAVVLDRGQVAGAGKVITQHDDLLVSVRAALENVLYEVKPKRIERLNLSTTLSTNAIIEGKTEDVGVVVSAGPGVDPENYRIGGHFHIVPGFIDHRGNEMQELDPEALRQAAERCSGTRVCAVVGKFFTRNPAHEHALAGSLNNPDFISLGHRLSGRLNFPRRIATAYYNSAVWRLYNQFADAVAASAKEFGITAPLNVLKADGGTLPLEMSRNLPVETILSGPAASVMGLIALADIQEDSLLLDMGGTTTDMAVFASGAPIVEREGIDMGSYPTLVRALHTRSIGIGGDSKVHLVEGRVLVGPERLGPAMCQGGTRPTLMDACNYLRLVSLGDREASAKGIEKLAGLWDMFPEKVARAAVDYAVEAIRQAVENMLADLNSKPVYTIFELLQGKSIQPRRVHIMGGPARVFQPLLSEALGKEVVAPEHYAVANAIGAALTRTTFEAELFADTEKGVLFIPKLDVEKRITSGYTLDDAKREVQEQLAGFLDKLGVSKEDRVLEITDASAFNMVDMFGGKGRNIRVKCQIRPGISR